MKKAKKQNGGSADKNRPKKGEVQGRLSEGPKSRATTVPRDEATTVPRDEATTVPRDDA